MATATRKNTRKIGLYVEQTWQLGWKIPSARWEWDCTWNSLDIQFKENRRRTSKAICVVSSFARMSYRLVSACRRDMSHSARRSPDMPCGTSRKTEAKASRCLMTSYVNEHTVSKYNDVLHIRRHRAIHASMRSQ